MSKADIKKIGIISVDSGTIYIGDPGYISSDKRLHDREGWEKFCEEVFDPMDKNKKEFSKENSSYPQGVVSKTTHGDGVYTVYAHMKNNKVSEIRIKF